MYSFGYFIKVSVKRGFRPVAVWKSKISDLLVLAKRSLLRCEGWLLINCIWGGLVKNGC